MHLPCWTNRVTELCPLIPSCLLVISVDVGDASVVSIAMLTSMKLVPNEASSSQVQKCSPHLCSFPFPALAPSPCLSNLVPAPSVSWYCPKLFSCPLPSEACCSLLQLWRTLLPFSTVALQGADAPCTSIGIIFGTLLRAEILTHILT